MKYLPVYLPSPGQSFGDQLQFSQPVVTSPHESVSVQMLLRLLYVTNSHPNPLVAFWQEALHAHKFSERWVETTLPEHVPGSEQSAQAATRKIKGSVKKRVFNLEFVHSLWLNLLILRGSTGHSSGPVVQLAHSVMPLLQSLVRVQIPLVSWKVKNLQSVSFWHLPTQSQRSAAISVPTTVPEHWPLSKQSPQSENFKQLSQL